MDRKAKIMSFVGFVMILTTLYPIALFYLEGTYGDLGNLNVMETYVPWMFHLILMMFIFQISVVLMVGWFILAYGDEEEEPKPKRKNHNNHKKRKKARSKPKQMISQEEETVEEPQEEVSPVEGVDPHPASWDQEEFE